MAGLKDHQTAYKHPPVFSGNIDGVIHLSGVTKEMLSYIQNLPVKADDVFIVTYPKSGTTWLLEIVCQIHSNGTLDSRTIHERALYLEALPHYKNIKTDEELRALYLNQDPPVFKSHLRYHELPISRDGQQTKPRCIYAVRNPKDVAVSFYYHYKNIKLYEFGDRTWDEFFDMFIRGEVEYGSWFDHLASWRPHRDDDNVLYLRYEDMKKDLPDAVQQIARFIGKDISTEVIQQIANQTTFKAMSGDKRFLPRSGLVSGVRKGAVGGWKNYFTEEQNEIFEELMRKKMLDIDL